MKRYSEVSVAWRCWWALVRLDGALFRLVLVDRVINFLIWGVTVVGCAEYLLPLFGMSASYGVFTAVGVLVSAGVFEAYGRIVELVMQLTEGGDLLYYGTLPIAATFMIMRIMVVNAVRGMVLSIMLLPVIKLLLGSGLSLAPLGTIPGILMFLVINLFCGVCTVLLGAQVRSIMDISNVWMRRVFPAWFLGGFQFTQLALLQAFPVIGWLNFANPLIYATEGMRAVLLGQEGYLNVWLCIGMLTCWTLVCGMVGIRRMKRRLDLI